ncbi:MAG: hypothetical protein P1S60_13390, partial [Anaerolineae bacterium]|nr:hypothetical protein [Anaerolineae bacterium]
MKYAGYVFLLCALFLLYGCLVPNSSAHTPIEWLSTRVPGIEVDIPPETQVPAPAPQDPAGPDADLAERLSGVIEDHLGLAQGSLV